MIDNIAARLKANEHWIGPIGVLIGLLGIMLSAYFYFADRQAGEVTLRFNTVKIADAGIPSIQIFDSNNQRILGTVFGCEIVVWNTGNLGLGDKSDRIREPLTIIFSSSANIIDATIQDIKNVPAEAIKLNHEGKRILVSWSQFDPGDAVKIFVIYSSNSQSPIEYHGRFLQTKIVDLSQFEEEHPELSGFAAFRSKLKYGLEHRPFAIMLIILFLIAAFVATIPVFFRRIRESRWALLIMIFVIGTLFANWIAATFEHFSTSNPFQ